MGKFTAQQIKDYLAYEKVRESGRFNMLDPRAIKASRLGDEAYFFVLKNFGALQEQLLKEPT